MNHDCGYGWSKQFHTPDTVAVQDDPLKLECPKCHKTFVSKGSLNAHMKLHFGVFKFWCDECKKGYNHRSNYQQHMAKHEGRTFPCQFCTKRFQTEKSLTNHTMSHTGLYRHRCSYCQKGFATRHQWEMHEKKH